MAIGTTFKVELFGASHGDCIGVAISGCPAGVTLPVPEIRRELDRRKPGQSKLTTSRKEPDIPIFLSGIFNGKTTGAPIIAIIQNSDARSKDYEKTKFLPRPSHADLTSWIKYGALADMRGGGIFSGRLTAGTVIAGAIAKHILREKKVKINSELIEVGGSSNKKQFAKIIENVSINKDSVDGVIRCVIENPAAGLGDPLDSPLDSSLAQALFSIPAVKGVEFGSTQHLGSDNNDPIMLKGGKIVTATNNAGGILGGISNGMPIDFTVHFKPTASIAREQKTVDLRTMKPAKLTIEGRHDPCVAVRAPPVVEAVAAIVLLDYYLRAGII